MEVWTGSEDLPIYGFIIRAAIIYVYIFLVVKILGQRSMVAFHPIDFIFAVIIGDIVGEPLSSGNIALGGPLVAASFIAGLHLLLSYLALKNTKVRQIVEAEPIIIIKKGHILVEELRKAKITVESLMMDLRLNQASDLTEIDYAILEPNGQISVIKKSEYNSLSPNDLGKNPDEKGIPTVLILEGNLHTKNLKSLGLTQEWLLKQVYQHGYHDVKDVFLMTIDETCTRIFISGEFEGKIV
ncbi:YetF domain-containing protein [Halalkalibacter krulwichiae]|uniref:YetF C-terminal domain-containing protein n=1 Tax=Halalkalibacter krulwichiae TaxID=199441 RepID=A0A1X9MAR4_9BACI|nr:DUF421 domain-containing protein [Halalkalibacter krulwichiae]ARK30539.1 hypothetical protein BkAM31D_12250 [Halalkalibacter krulwichiae]